MNRAKRKESGLDKFLKESMAGDPQFRALFLAEAKKLPRRTQKRVLRNLHVS